jgi:sugar O-acyltransferase (sialic acid O-acetyltransferase NeuD family)
VKAFIDDTPNKLSPIEGIPIYQGMNHFQEFLQNNKDSITGFVIAIGNPHGNIRVKLNEELKAFNLVPISFADPTALICKSVTFGEGLQVMTSAVVEGGVRIGKQCIINTRALVTHDCELADGVEIAPGAVLCGRVKVGENTWIGANACVRPRIIIGSNTIVGAGSVVVSDIPDNVVVTGVPAKVLRKNITYE